MLRLATALCLFGLALPVMADPAVDAGLAEVRELGALNGQALACSQTQASARVKALMILRAPKSRRYGEAFEAATSDAFLAQTRKEPSACQDEAALLDAAEAIEKRLQAALATTVSQ